MAQSNSPDPVSIDELHQLGERLRKARSDRELSAEEAGQLSGVKASTILRYERGEAEPGALRIAALANLYGACCNWLLGNRTIPAMAEAGHAVADLDRIDAVEKAKTEQEMSDLVLWRPPPIIAVVSIPSKRRLVDGQEAQGIGSFILDRLKAVAPRTYMRWSTQHSMGTTT